eukprot:gene20086-1035_t
MSKKTGLIVDGQYWNQCQRQLGMRMDLVALRKYLE